MLRLQPTVIFSKEKLRPSRVVLSLSAALGKAASVWAVREGRLPVRHHTCQCAQLCTDSQKPDDLPFQTKP